MCTFIVAWQVFPDAPVVVAANRDEALDRPAHPPGVYAENPRIVAPWDEEAGGTWIGYNDHGVVAAVTNRWIDADLAAERSRGLLVADVLERESAEEAARFIERSTDRYEYDGFNLVVLDENAALLLEWDGRLRVENLDPGVHVVVNVGADDRYEIPAARPEVGERQAENARRAIEKLQPEPGERAEAWHERAATALRDHDYGFCVHGDVTEESSADQPEANASGRGFGTRSSSLIRTESDGKFTYRFADGPPCRSEYEPVDVQV
ncbi:NRDE family protein [Halalkalicoccus ordinarius]|uniref:NRDE family protein n=1 Tax=Halalkalicoccus ordinarius TaxID=3116651 RepID=UPI00300EF47E